jgi:peptide/nickel transport system permease protein
MGRREVSAVAKHPPATAAPARRAPGRSARLLSACRRFADRDLVHDFLRSPMALGAALVALGCLFVACFAGTIAPHDPFDLASLDLDNARLPPAWLSGGSRHFLIGTDAQGRDLLSAIIFGTRISLVVGVGSVLLSVLLGVSAGLVSGFVGGRLDALVMRICDVMLSFPAILIALLVDGVGHVLFPDANGAAPFLVLILAISLTGWVQHARTVRGLTLVERERDYVQAARVIGVGRLRIMASHVLPNVLGPVMVLATIQVGQSIVVEATLSYLGVGVPPTSPSLGTLIRLGNAYLFSGEWWIAVFPGCMLIAIALSVNLLGDWLRDALNPRLR